MLVHRLIDKQQADSSGELRDGGIEQKRKKLMDMDNSVVIVGGGGWVEVEEGMGGINGDGKNKREIKNENI